MVQNLVTLADASYENVNEGEHIAMASPRLKELVDGCPDPKDRTVVALLVLYVAYSGRGSRKILI